MSDFPRVLAQIFRFAMVSGVSLAIDASIYALLSSQFELDGSLAKRISFACIAVWAYFAHKYFTFHDRAPNGSEPLKFALLYLSGWLINSFVHDMALAEGGKASSPAFIVATFAWACWNFLGQKFFVFRHADEKPSSSR